MKIIPSSIYGILTLILIVVLVSCKQDIKNHIPSKSEKISQGEYDKYLGLLNKAYGADNKFEAGIQLANLGTGADVTYEMLDAGIIENVINCERIYQWYFLYQKHNFGVNLLKLDTIRFQNSVRLCDDVNTNDSYANYEARKIQEEKDIAANKPLEDSTGFNLLLVRVLKEIMQDDQDVRNRFSGKNINSGQKEILMKEMRYVDSINLMKIDKIFQEFGYPSKELVGEGGNITPALVIHHSSDLATRYKYLPLLEQATQDGVLNKGTLGMIKKRIADMELVEK